MTLVYEVLLLHVVLKAMYEYMYDSGIALKVSIVIDQAVVKKFTQMNRQFVQLLN